MRRWNLTSCLLAVATTLAWASSATHAYLIRSWDVDTLVALSPVIVEGEVVKVDDTGIELRVAHAYRGQMKEGSSFVFGQGPYRTSAVQVIVEGKSVPSGDFAPGDRLICFLGPQDRASGMENYDKTKLLNIYGLRMISDGKVVNFKQRGNPGYSVAQLEPEYAALRIPLDEFQKQLTAEVQKEADIWASIKKAVAEKNSRQLLAILQQRPVSNDSSLSGADLLTHEALSALVMLHDYPVLADALLLKNAPNREMAAAFYTVEGREFLLQMIADSKVNVPQRIACTSVLPYQGMISISDNRALHDPHYVTRLAQLATANGDSPELCAVLAGRVGGPPGDPDVLEGMAILTKLYSNTANEQIRYAIEAALSSNNAAAYNALEPPGGFVLAIVKTHDPDQAGKPVGRQFRVMLEWATLLPDKTPRPLQTEFFLEPAAGGAVISCGVGEPIVGGKSQRGWPDQAIALPDSSPAGKYRVYAQFSENGKIVGKSHFLEVDILPK